MCEYTWTNWAATLAPPTFQDSTKTIDPFFFPFFLFFFVVSSFFFRPPNVALAKFYGAESGISVSK